MCMDYGALTQNINIFTHSIANSARFFITSIMQHQNGFFFVASAARADHKRGSHKAPAALHSYMYIPLHHFCPPPRCCVPTGSTAQSARVRKIMAHTFQQQHLLSIRKMGNATIVFLNSNFSICQKITCSPHPLEIHA